MGIDDKLQSARETANDKIDAARTKGRELQSQAQSKLHDLDEKTREPREKALEFAKEHPIATVAGGLVAGVIIGALMPRPRNVVRGVRTMGSEIGGATSAAIAAISAAGREQLATISEEASRIGSEVSHRVADAADSARVARDEGLRSASERSKILRLKAGHSAEIAKIRLKARKEIAKARAQARIAKARSRF